MNKKNSSGVLIAAACIISATAINAEPAPDFTHDVTTEKKPWTHTNFRENGSGDFHFAIIGDRSGRPEPGVFEKALAKANQLGPDFIMSVGDFIEGASVEEQSSEYLQQQWNRVKTIVETSRSPFFWVVGNHDISHDGEGIFTGMHDKTVNLWNRQFGPTYYSFVRKNVLFICLCTIDGAQEPITEKQVKWFLETLKKHQDLRWTMIFMHNPDIWHNPRFAEMEKALYDRNYTVFAGDYHQYIRYNRNGRHYYMLGPAGGGWDTNTYNARSRGKVFGEIHHITWVSMQDGIPKVTILPGDEIEDGDMVTTDKITWLTPKYFRGNKKISADELDKLRARGLIVTDKE